MSQNHHYVPVFYLKRWVGKEVAGFVAIGLLVRAEDRRDNETSRDGIKRGIDYARAEAKDDPALIDGLGV